MTQAYGIAINTVKKGRRVRVRLPGTVVGLLCAYGVYLAIHAIRTLARGGTGQFGGLFDYPVWALAHFASALLFVALVPVQLSARLRSRHRRVHRVCGRIAASAGVVLALSGVPLVYAMPARPFGERLFMTTFGLVFPLMLTKAVVAARRRDFVQHREWMIRVVAGGLAPMTQRLIFPVFAAVLGIRSFADFWEYFVAALWLSAAIHFAAAEWIISRTRRRAEGVREDTYAMESFMRTQSASAVAPMDS